MIATALQALQQDLGDLPLSNPTSPELAVRARAWRSAAWAEARAHHELGASGESVVRTLSAAADVIVRAACDAAATHAGDPELAACVVVCALGGYGRHELSPQSDLDLCLLYRDPLRDSIKAANAYLVPFYWDAGFDSGYVLQSVPEATEIALSEPAMLTSYLMSRPLWGNPEILAELKAAIGGLETPAGASCLEQAMQRCNRDTLSPQHAERFSREPNLKEQAGGLRDYHAARWMLALTYGDVPLDVLVARGVLPQDAVMRLNEGLDFLWRLRNELHWWRGRRSDTLEYAAQEHVALAFAYGGNPTRAVELLMQDYYAAARSVRDFLRLAARVCHQHEERDAEPETPSEASRQIHVLHHKIHAGADDDRWFTESPPRLMRVFWESARLRLPVSEATLARITTHLHLVNEEFQGNDLVRRFFFAICAHAEFAGRVLRQMAECGLLGAYLPEYGKVCGLVRHRAFHSFPVDEHTLRAIEALSEIPSVPGRVGRFLEKTLEHVQEPNVLVLAILFHDLGKAGSEEGHVEAGITIVEECAARCGWPNSVTEAVAFLVRFHMFMNEISMYRDTDDPAVVKTFADTMRSDERLRQLLLLSYCDLRAVAPGVWNEWKGALLVKLCLKTERILSGRGDGMADEAWKEARLAEAIAVYAETANMQDTRMIAGAMRAHFENFGDRYLLAFRAPQIAAHLRAIEGMASTGLFVWHALDEKSHMSEVTVVTSDRTGLFASITGALTTHGAAVQSASLFTGKNQGVVDVFLVTDAREHRPLTEQQFAAFERTLRAVLLDGEDLQRQVDQSRRRLFAILHPPAPVATRVSFDDTVSPNDTVLDIESGDRTGLLYDVATVLSDNDISVLSARINTDSLRVRDAFHIQENGQPIKDPMLRERLRAQLLARLDPLTAGH